MYKIGIIGSGPVAKSLGSGLRKHGYDVKISSRDLGKQQQIEQETGVQTVTFEEAASFGDIIIFAVKGTASEQVVSSLANQLSGKIVIDTCNPIADQPPVNGVLQFFTSQNESLMERLQKIVPEAHFVKAFSCIGSPFMIDPSFDQTPTMFICGNNSEAKKTVSELLQRVGWEALDMGMIESARGIEPLCILWCIPGIRENKWNHAFKLMEQQPAPVFAV